MEHKITWRQTGPSRWIGQDSDGYSLRVSVTDVAFRWSLHPPGAGYAVSSGESPSQDEAVRSVEKARATLAREIREASNKRVQRMRKDHQE